MNNRQQLARQIVRAFVARGIPANKIQPGHNVRTARGWNQVGRHVQRGARGVAIDVVVESVQETRRTKTETVESITCRTERKTVYHVSQTRPIKRPEIIETTATPAGQTLRIVKK